MRKLILGETWALPIGIGVAVGAAALLGGSGIVLLVALLGVLLVSLWPQKPRKHDVKKL
jgi:uncharacterized protein (DUF58 family)